MAAEAKINLLHLRHAAGWGGGPDTVLPFKLGLLDKQRFRGSVAYLVNRGEEIGPIARNLRDAGVELTELPGSRWFDPLQLYRLHRLVRAKQIDILHCHEPKSDLYGGLLKLLNPRLKLVSTLHGWIVRSWKSQLFNEIDRFCLRFYRLRIAVSSATQRQGAQRGLKDIVLLRNGVDIDYWDLGPQRRQESAEGRWKIGFAGRLSKEKGPADFLRACHAIAEKYPECEFLLAGEGPELEALKVLTCQLGIAGQVRFLGLLSKEQMKSFYQQLDLLLLTSYTEGLPNVVLQALAMQLPVVATRVGGVAELILPEQTGLLVEPGDLAGLAEQGARLLADRPLARKLGQQGRQLMVEEFSMARRVRRLERFYLQLMGRDELG